MEFKIKICDEDNESNIRFETYIENITDPESYAKEIIENFNNTLRPNEKRRKYLGYEIISDKQLHEWEKTNGATVFIKGNPFDLFQCSVCGITGKRYGVNSIICRDPKYKAAKYEYCKKLKEVKS